MREFRKNSCDSKRNWRIILPECEGEADAYWEFEGSSPVKTSTCRSMTS